MGIILRRRREEQKKAQEVKHAPPLPVAPKQELTIPKPSLPLPPKLVQSKHIVLILAAGEEVAWEKKIGTAKQLLSLGTETVLGRIIRQVRGLKREPILVTHREDFIDVAKGVDYYEPASRTCIADTILHTRELWGAHTLILLGDVVFGKGDIGKMVARRGRMKVLGNSAEVFAFSFHSFDHDYFASVLERSMAHKRSRGTPWQIYRIYCGKDPARGYIDKGTFEWTQDQTGDIDSLYEYNAMKGIAGRL